MRNPEDIGVGAKRHTSLLMLKELFPVGSPAWRVYRRIKTGKALAPGYILHGNVLLEDAKAIYLYIPKVACSTMKLICAQYLNIAPKGQQDLAESIHEAAFPYVKRYRMRRHYREYFKFAFVRNPWDRLVSCYKDKLCDAAGQYVDHENRFTDYLTTTGRYKEDMTFDEFVSLVASIPDRRAEGHFRSQVALLSDSRGLIPLDRIARFEHLEDEFSYISARLGLNGSLPHLRTTGKRHYREYYSQATRELVRQRYQADIETFSYEF
jgi:hypothetical protein